MKTFLLFTLLAFPSQSFALTVQFGKASDQKIESVTLSDSATITDGNKNIPLVRVASGLREKRILLLNFKVYATQVFTTKPIDKKSAESALDSLVKNQPTAISLTFLMNVGINKIVDAFQEALTDNGVQVNTEPFKTFLSEVKNRGEAKKDLTFWFVLDNAEGNDRLSFYAATKDSFTVSAPSEKHLSKDFLSIWFGKTKELTSLQSQLLK